MNMYPKKITPNQYAFHITNKTKRHLILKDGLKANDDKAMNYGNAIFAHNSPYITDEWYPFIMNYYGDLDKTEFKNILNEYYYIWRVDTVFLKRDWFLDWVGQVDFPSTIFNSENLYIMNYDNIPLEASTLCNTQFKDTFLELKHGWFDFIATPPTPLYYNVKVA